MDDINAGVKIKVFPTIIRIGAKLSIIQASDEKTEDEAIGINKRVFV